MGGTTWVSLSLLTRPRFRERIEKFGVRKRIGPRKYLAYRSLHQGGAQAEEAQAGVILLGKDILTQ